MLCLNNAQYETDYLSPHGSLRTEQKSNEIRAILELIKMLAIKGALVTIDAIACQTKIAKTIVDKGGDYILAVKNNRGTLRQALEKVFSSRRSGVNDNIAFERPWAHRLTTMLCFLEATYLRVISHVGKG